MLKKLAFAVAGFDKLARVDIIPYPVTMTYFKRSRPCRNFLSYVVYLEDPTTNLELKARFKKIQVLVEIRLVEPVNTVF